MPNPSSRVVTAAERAAPTGPPPRALVVTGLRLPCTVVGLAVGAALGFVGAVAQGGTRDPLASPTALGIDRPPTR